ncbi:MAG: hypothetical protein MHMPM18_004425, partial [Marteilia pararefringens]
DGINQQADNRLEEIRELTLNEISCDSGDLSHTLELFSSLLFGCLEKLKIDESPAEPHQQNSQLRDFTKGDLALCRNSIACSDLFLCILEECEVASLEFPIDTILQLIDSIKICIERNDGDKVLKEHGFGVLRALIIGYARNLKDSEKIAAIINHSSEAHNIQDSDPDVCLNSLKLLTRTLEMYDIKDTENHSEKVANLIRCVKQSEFMEIRLEALKAIKILITNSN